MKNVEPTSCGRARRMLCQRKRWRGVAMLATCVALICSVVDTRPAWNGLYRQSISKVSTGATRGSQPANTVPEISLVEEVEPAPPEDTWDSSPLPTLLTSSPPAAAQATAPAEHARTPEETKSLAGDQETLALGQAKKASKAFLASRAVDGAVAESVIDVLANGGVPYSAWLNTLEHMKDDQLERVVRGAESTKSWGVVFPFRVDPNPMSHRAKVIAASWRSICRAMRQQRKATFHVIAIDDSGELIEGSTTQQIDSPNFKRTGTHFNVPNFESAIYAEKWVAEWTEACGAPNLKTLTHVEGHHSIPQNMEMGYDWASQYDYIVNFDSDLLAQKDTFSLLEHDFQQAENSCGIITAVSGFSSNLNDGQGVGNNLLLSSHGYTKLMKHKHGKARKKIWNAGKRPEDRKNWADILGHIVANFCGNNNFPLIPINSYVHHIGFNAIGEQHETDSVRLASHSLWSDWRDNYGLRIEQNRMHPLSLRFEWDEFNTELISELNPFYGPYAHAQESRWTSPKSGDPPTSALVDHTSPDHAAVRDGCFDGPFNGHYLLSCAVDSDVLYRWCQEFRSLEEAQYACLMYESCGGVTEMDAGLYTLRVGSQLIEASGHDGCLQWILPRSWVRRVHSSNNAATDNVEADSTQQPTVADTEASTSRRALQPSSKQAAQPLPSTQQLCKMYAPDTRRVSRCRDCADCTAGGEADGGKQLEFGRCLAFCSLGGFCGNEVAYFRGTDCTDCADVLRPFNAAGEPLPIGPPPPEPVTADIAVGPPPTKPLSPEDEMRANIERMEREADQQSRRQLLDATEAALELEQKLEEALEGLPEQQETRVELQSLHRRSMQATVDILTDVRGVEPIAGVEPLHPGVQQAASKDGVAPIPYTGTGDSWGVVLPFHGGPQSQRLDEVTVAWRSICRAMRAKTGADFHVIAIDDSGTRLDVAGGVNSTAAIEARNQPPISNDYRHTTTHLNVPNFDNSGYMAKWETQWRDMCNAPNLVTLHHVEGHKAIPANMVMGYEWAAQFDYIVNFDSDLLVIEDFFKNMEIDYQEAKTHCQHAIITGYTSNVMVNAYGANYMFGRETYKEVVSRVTGAVKDPYTKQNVDDKAWDTKLDLLELQACGEFPRRPDKSYVHHMAPKEGLHYDRDGDLEAGLRFEWDLFNLELKKETDALFVSRSYLYTTQKLQVKTTTDISLCFEDPMHDHELQHCTPMTDVFQDHPGGMHSHCPSFETLADAQATCLRLELCNGIVKRGGTYSLYSGTQLQSHGDRHIPNCYKLDPLESKVTSYIRAKEPTVDGVCVGDPNDRSTAQIAVMKESFMQVKRKCDRGYFGDGSTTGYGCQLPLYDVKTYGDDTKE